MNPTTSLKAMAEKTGKTQSELAGKLGVSVVHMNKLLNGKVAPSLEMAFRLAAEFGSTVSALWELTEVGIVARAAQNRRR